MLKVDKMNKPILKISVSDTDTSSANESDSDIDINPKSTDSDGGAISSSIQSDLEDNNLTTNEGWADSISKILSSTKPKNKKTLVLSRAKKHSEIAILEKKEEKPSFEVIGATKEEKTDNKKNLTNVTQSVPKKKVEKPSIRIKPNILEKDRERLLAKIATKGVVQLFNAVRNQQKIADKQINRKDLSEYKKDKILKKFDKRDFLDTLMGQTKSINVDEQTKAVKSEIKSEEQTRWNALRDNFMMGAKMKDWDKESTDE